MIDKDYFTIFGLQRDFSINLEMLDFYLFELQMLYHPDRLITQTPEEKAIAAANSSIINQAYKILKNPLTRAEYILKLENMHIDDVEIPQKLLMQAMEWREILEEAQDIKIVKELLDEFLRREKNVYQVLAEYFIKKLYVEALKVYVELKFYSRLKQEIINKIEFLNEVI